MVLTDGDCGVLPLRAAPGATERRRRDRIGPADGLSGTVERDFAAMRVKLLRGKDAAGVLLVYPSTLGEYGEAIEAIGRRAASGLAGPRSGGSPAVSAGSADWLSPEPAAEALQPAPAAPPDGPAVVLDRQVASAREL